MNEILAPTLREKLHALYMLGRHMGMWGPGAPAPEVPRAPAERIVAAASLALNPNTPPIARHCYAMMLEYWFPQWRTLVPPESLGLVVERDSPEVRGWREAVLRRDGRRCVRCGGLSKLHAHHIIPWALAPELRLVVGNGETLCSGCHSAEHPEMAEGMFN